MGGKGWRGKRKNRGKGKGAGGDQDGEGEGEAPRKARKTESERARNDIWREEPGSWEKVNESYEAYYKRQRVCPEEDWPKLLQALRTGLPVAIRINRMRYGSASLCERLREMRDACAGDEGREHFAPVQLSWYQHSLAWHWHGLERRTVKKDRRNVQLKDFLTQRERSGLISRQEAVSMIPPLFLSVEPHHMVLDLCAAPGSKTAQILEIMHFPPAGKDTYGAPTSPSGMVVANELQWKRANMLAHQVQRLGSPCAAVVNMDAQFFPEVWVTGADGNPTPLRFDRVLCDVPCSGDGTMRKTPYIWRSWTLRDGLALHVRQLGILLRGLDLLKVGGRLVYSTCSLNPVEDEAVVAAALQRHGRAIALVPPAGFEGLNAAKGLREWIIQEPSGGPFYETFESVPSELKEGKCRIQASMFPPIGEGSEEHREALHQNCRRCLPHLMDTGGFFVAIFEKREEFKPSARMRRDDRQMQMQAQKRRQEAGEGAAAEDKAGGDVAEAGGAAAPGPDAAAAEAEEPWPSSASTAPCATQGLRKLTREYAQVKGNGSTWTEICRFYGFDDALAHRFVLRSEKDDRIFLLSEGVSQLLRAETRMPTRMVLCGVVALERAASCHVRACPWRLSQQGIAAVNALGLRRRISVSRGFLIRLLREKELTLAELRAAAAQGDVRGLERLVPSGASDATDLCPGSLVVVFDAAVEGSSGVVPVAANLAEDMLEVAIGSATETASLLEELEGQPSVDLILQAPPAEAGADAEVADEDEAEDCDAPEDQEGADEGT